MSADWDGLVGIAFAALLASIGYVYQMRVEYNKSARRVLYLLLEIRASVLAAVFDPRDATKLYVQHFMSRCQSRGINMKAIQLPENLICLIETHFERSFSVARSKLEERLLRAYEEALLQLAVVLPVLAYRMLGRERLERLVEPTRMYIDNLSHLVKRKSEEPGTQELSIALISKVQREAYEAITSTLDGDVLTLAWVCGYIDYWRCRALVKKSPFRMNELLVELDPHIDQLLQMIVDAAVTNGLAARQAECRNAPSPASQLDT